VPGGEIAVAVVQASATEAGLVLIVDVTGHQKEADNLLKKIVIRLTEQGATKVRANSADVSALKLPPAKDRDKTVRHAAYHLKGDLFIAGDNISIVETIVTAAESKPKKNLSTFTPFAKSMERCKTAAGELAPHIRWFVEPFGYIEASRILNPPREKKRGKDMLEALRNQGFDAIQGAGGYVNFMAGKYEILHRTAVYAPAVEGEKERYRLAARMLDFPNGTNHVPEAFVPRELASYITYGWDVQKAFEAVGSLVDEVANEKNLFEDVLDSLKNAKKGPKVDLRKELVAHLKHRVSIVSDYQVPVGPQSERLLFAIEVTDAEAVAGAIAKAMGADKEVFRREFEGHIIWEVVEEKSEIPTIEIEGVGDDFDRRRDDEEEEEEEDEPRLLPHAAMTVANGHLLVASHIDFLQKALTTAKGKQTLGGSVDYRIIMAELDKLAGSPSSMRGFARTDEAYRATYELLRAGKMPQSESVVGRVLNAMFDVREGEVRVQKLDGSKLPDYEVVRRYLGPAGTVVVSEDTGWIITGITLNKELPEEMAAEPTDVKQPQ